MWLVPMPNLNPFYDKIFTSNINSMTDAAKAYFTTARLAAVLYIDRYVLRLEF